MKHSITVILDDTVTPEQTMGIVYLFQVALEEMDMWQKSTLKTEIVLEKRTDDLPEAGNQPEASRPVAAA